MRIKASIITAKAKLESPKTTAMNGSVCVKKIIAKTAANVKYRETYRIAE